MTKYRVIYLARGRERVSAWFHSLARANTARQMMQTKYGANNVIVFRD